MDLWKMQVLTIKQPFASAILELGKDVENRTWSTPYRGKLIIHSSKSRPTLAEKQALLQILNFTGQDIPSQLICGSILGQVEASWYHQKFSINVGDA